jgi:hypothetical protein
MSRFKKEKILLKIPGLLKLFSIAVSPILLMASQSIITMGLTVVFLSPILNRLRSSASAMEVAAKIAF